MALVEKKYGRPINTTIQPKFIDVPYYGLVQIISITPETTESLTTDQKTVLKTIKEQFDKGQIPGEPGTIEGIGSNANERLVYDQVDIWLLPEAIPSRGGKTDLWVVLPKEHSVTNLNVDTYHTNNYAKLTVEVTKPDASKQFIKLETALTAINVINGAVQGFFSYDKRVSISHAKGTANNIDTARFKNAWMAGEPTKDNLTIQHSNLAGFVLFFSKFSVYCKGVDERIAHEFNGLIVKLPFA